MMTRGQRWRTLLLGFLIVCSFVGLTGRVVVLQLGDQEELRQTVDRRKSYRRELSGMRGRILDCNNRVMALDVTQKHIAIDPSYISQNSNPVKIHRALISFLPVEPAMVAGRLRRTDAQYLMVKKYVDAAEAEKLAGHLAREELGGVVIKDAQARKYPHGNLMCHVIGFANRQGVGSAGVEQRQDRYLREKRGVTVSEKDGRRRERIVRRHVQIDAEDGADVHLTLDQYIQHMVEVELEKAIEHHQADGAWAVVLRSETAEVLAMASKPDFDPNEYSRADPEHRRNRTINMVYEPGSIMKPIVMAAVMNENLVDPDEIIDTENGVWYYRNRPLSDYHGYPELSAADCLKKSSNIGLAKMGLRLGARRLEAYLRAFGFGRRTGIGLPGEESGIFWPHRRWDSLTITRIPMGHAISTTALQMAAAINVIANDGRLVLPYVVSEVRENNGFVRYRHKPEVVDENVIRPEVAAEMRALMARITEKGGTGRRAGIEGYKVAGKTGTSEKIIDGRYSDTDNYCSFAGFVPADNPEYTIVVTIDNPRQNGRTAGLVAAPVFREIAANAIRYEGVQPEGTTEAH